MGKSKAEWIDELNEEMEEYKNMDYFLKRRPDGRCDIEARDGKVLLATLGDVAQHAKGQPAEFEITPWTCIAMLSQAYIDLRFNQRQ